MRFNPSLLDKLVDPRLADRPGEILRGHSLEELKDSVASDLEALLNTRAAIADEALRDFPLAGQSVLSFGVADFSSRSLASGLDRDHICATIQAAIVRHDRRLRNVEVALTQAHPTQFNRLDFTIRALLVVTEAGEQVSFDARFEPLLHRYAVTRQRATRGTPATGGLR